MTVYSSPPPERLTDEQWKSRASFAREKDAADKLPAAAKDKLLALRNELDEARAVIAVPKEKLAEARRKRDAVELRLSKLVRDMGERHPLVIAEREVFERLNGEVRAASDEYGRRVDAIGPLGNMLKRTAGYVSSVPTPVGMAPAVVPKLAKGVSVVAAIEQARERVQAHKDAIQAAIDAPFTSADVKRKMRAEVTALAESGRPSVAGAIDFGEPIKFANAGQTFIGHTVAGEAVTSNEAAFDAQATLCWLFRDQIIAALDSEIDDVADDANALTTDERRKRIADAKKALLAAEREEEELVCMARESGLTVARRHDCDPRAILGLADSAPAPRDD